MTGIAELAIVGTATAVATAACLVAVRPVLSRGNVLDVPSHRSAHTEPTVRGAGIGVAAGVAVGAAVAVAIADGTARLGVTLAAVVALVAAILGAREDVAGLTVKQRLGLQTIVALVGAATLVVWSGASVWWCLPFVVWTVGYINVANFMDGVNGISGLHGLATGGFFVALGRTTGSDTLMVLGLVTAVGFTTWLPWNFARRRMFLGDAGSYLLGALVSVCAMVAVLEGVPAPAAVAPAAIYVADAAWTLGRRALRGERWYEAHRSHAYQRLVDAGWSHLAVSAIVAALSATCGAAALVAVRDPAAGPWSAAAVVAVCGVYLTTPRWLRRRARAATVAAPIDESGRRAA